MWRSDLVHAARIRCLFRVGDEVSHDTRGTGRVLRGERVQLAVAVAAELERTQADDCDLLLVGNAEWPQNRPGPQWKAIWEGSRPMKSWGRYRLYQKIKGDAQAVDTIGISP